MHEVIKPSNNSEQGEGEGEGEGWGGVGGGGEGGELIMRDNIGTDVLLPL